MPLAVFITALLSLGAAALSLFRLRSVLLVCSFDLAAIKTWLGSESGASAARLSSLAGRLGASAPGSWEAELCGVVVSARVENVASALASEILFEAGNRLSWGVNVPAGCMRISMFSAVLGAALLLAEHAQLNESVFAVVCFGATGALISLSAGKEASLRVRRMRAQIDAFSTAIIGARRWVPEPESLP